MEVEVEVKEAPDDGKSRAQAEGAGCNEEGGNLWGKSVFGEDGGDVHGHGEGGVNGNAGDVDSVAWEAEAFHVDFIFLLGSEVPVECACYPEGVEVVVGDDNSEFCVEAAGLDEEGDDASGHEVGTDDGVRAEVFDEVDERQGLGQVENKAAFIGDPGVIGCFIPPTEEIREECRELFID